MLPDLFDRKDEIVALCEKYGVARLSLFGSAASGELRDDSDVDLLVEFLQQHPIAYDDRYFGLLESLAELTGRQIDLVVESAIRNPYFRESVESTRVALYAA